MKRERTISAYGTFSTPNSEIEMAIKLKKEYYAE